MRCARFSGRSRVGGRRWRDAMKTLLTFLLILFCLDGSAQVLNRDLPNSFTYASVIPYGCLKVVPAVRSAPPAETFFDTQVLVADNGATGLVRIRARSEEHTSELQSL